MIDRKECLQVEESNCRANFAKARSLLRSECEPVVLFQTIFADLRDRLQEPYGLRIVNKPVVVIAPLYRQIIVPVRPVTLGAFRKLYGVTIDLFVTLVKQGRIVPILSKPYNEYPELFDPLFRLGHIPLASRVTRFFESNRREVLHFDDIQELREDLAEAKFADELYERYGEKGQDKILNIIVDHLVDLKVFGYDELCSGIMETKDVNTLFLLAASAADLLTDPFTRALGGFSNYDCERLLVGREAVNQPQEYEGLLFHFPHAIELATPRESDTLNYWDELDSCKEREAVLEAIKKYPARIRGGMLNELFESLKGEIGQITEISISAAKSAVARRWKPIVNFGFSALVPAALALFNPFVGTGALLVTQGMQEFRRRKWDSLVLRASKLLTSAEQKWATSVKVAPAVLWRKQP